MFTSNLYSPMFWNNVHIKSKKEHTNVLLIYTLTASPAVTVYYYVTVVCLQCVSAAVEACILHGLKRRAAGFLRSNKVAALFMKVGKSFGPAEELCKKAQELEQVMETK